MSKIARGVEYIHRERQIHRDIKPGNGGARLGVTDLLVLYFSKSSVWKLADFGLSTEGSSKRNLPSKYSSGTPGYRALELMDSEGDPAMYNNKVDIWAMGCILYELATGTRAFKTDHAVISYSLSPKAKEVVLDNTFDSDSIKAITKHIADMLQISPSDRPSTSILSKEFDRQLGLAQDGIQLSTVTNSVTSLAVNAKIEPTLPMPQKYEAIASSGILLAVTDETEQTPVMPQKHQVGANETENDTPSLPPRLLGVSLYEVAAKGDIEAVEALLNAKANVTTRDDDRRTALHRAAEGGHGAVVELLLGGMDPETIGAQDKLERTALHLAAGNGHGAVVELLLGEMDSETIGAREQRKSWKSWWNFFLIDQ